MFSKKELEDTADYAERKFNETLNSDKGTDLDYIRDLQNLAKIKDSANKALDDMTPK